VVLNWPVLSTSPQWNRLHTELNHAPVFGDFREAPFLQSKKCCKNNNKNPTPLPKQRTWLISSPLSTSPAQYLVCEWKYKLAVVTRFPALRNQKAQISFVGCRLQISHFSRLHNSANKWRWAN